LYQGTRDLVFEVANMLQANRHAPTPQELDPFRKRETPGAPRASPLTRH
ncbi:MAG: nitrogenase iron-molybdenum cofactor biosynthesis protein NifN, partial [Mesorhizobium sp.]